MPEPPNNSPIAKFLPATVIPDSGLSDDRLEFASGELDSARIRCERNEQGSLRMYPPPPEAVWLMIQSLHRELLKWLAKAKIAGQAAVRQRFFLENYSMMCPDIAFVAPRGEGKRVEIRYGHPLSLCPNFVIEFCTHPKELRGLQDKMLRWIASGAELGWLVVPQEQCIYGYTTRAEAVIMDGEYAGGRGPWEQFVVYLPEIWNFDQYKRPY